MRRIGSAVVVITIAIVCGACSGGSSAAALSLEEVHGKIVDSGIACNGTVGPYKPAADELDIGVKISKSFKCKVGGAKIEADEFASSGDAKAALALLKSFACGFGGPDFSYVAEGKWMATADNDDSETDTAMTKKVADALGVEVRTVKCSDKSADTSPDNDASAASTTLTDPDDLVSADKAARDAAKQVDIGAQVDVGDGLFLKVSGINVGEDDSPYFELDMRAENRGGEDQSVPNIAIVCAGSTEEGGWIASSTFELYETVRAGSFTEGHLDLSVPGDDRVGEAVPECKAPAVIRIESGDDDVDVAIPADALADLNSKLSG